MSTILYPKFKLWFIDKDGKAIFGESLAELLEAIEVHRSVFKASRQLSTPSQKNV